MPSKSLNEWRDEIHTWARSKGWWGRSTDNIAGKLLLVHSEISEAAEELRKAGPCPHGGPDVDWDDLRKTTRWEGKPEGFPSELADTIIRILDICGRVNIDIDEIMKIKMEYNYLREQRHGGKAL